MKAESVKFSISLLLLLGLFFTRHHIVVCVCVYVYMHIYMCVYVCNLVIFIVFMILVERRKSDGKIKNAVKVLRVSHDSEWVATTSSSLVVVNGACESGDFYFGGVVWCSLTQCWCFQEKRTFQIPWMHAARHGWDLEKDAPLFMKWAIHTGSTLQSVQPPECARSCCLPTCTIVGQRSRSSSVNVYQEAENNV